MEDMLKHNLESVFKIKSLQNKIIDLIIKSVL